MYDDYFLFAFFIQNIISHYDDNIKSDMATKIHELQNLWVFIFFFISFSFARKKEKRFTSSDKYELFEILENYQ